MKRTMLLILSILVYSGVFKAQLPYQDPKLSDEKRIDDLISRLSLAEKTSLMLYNSPAIGRFGIPEYNWWSEALHGVARAGKATVFPQAIALAATFDDSLVFRIANAVSDEARAKHREAVKKGNFQQYTGLSFWTPNINIFRDPRWGRGQETYGEDPYLTSRMGVAFVKGLQGNDPEHLKVSACAKHYIVHSGPEKIRHEFNVLPEERDFRETYLPAFKALVDAGVESVMCAYNRVNDKPCCGSIPLLTDLLRNELGFRGHIVSDCWALDDIWARHKVVATRAEAAAMAAKAGVNLNCGYIYQYIPEAVGKGLVDEKTIDNDLKYLLRTRVKLDNLFSDSKSPWDTIPADVVDSPEHRKLAYTAAVKSMVLLKNNGVLPIDQKKLKNLFVTGPTANDFNVLTGNYNGLSGNMVTLLEGIVGSVDAGTVVESNQGFLYNNDSVYQGFWQASRADVTIVCIGISGLFEGEEGEAMYNPEGGDRSRIELPANQVTYVKKMRERMKEKPMVVVVTGGSAIAMPEVIDLADAVVFAWYPGEEGGNALASILFGKENPSGRLPVTFYRSTGDLPPFDDYRMDNRTYRYFRGKTLFEFGYGLSYTTFGYDRMTPDKIQYSVRDTIRVEVSLTNTGKYDGDEIVQLYVSNPVRSETAEVKSLKGFKRIHVQRKKVKSAIFSIPVSELGHWNKEKGRFEVAPGKYILEAGASSSDIRIKKQITVI